MPRLRAAPFARAFRRHRGDLFVVPERASLFRRRSIGHEHQVCDRCQFEISAPGVAQLGIRGAVLADGRPGARPSERPAGGAPAGLSRASASIGSGAGRVLSALRQPACARRAAGSLGHEPSLRQWSCMGGSRISSRLQVRRRVHSARSRAGGQRRRSGGQSVAERQVGASAPTPSIAAPRVAQVGSVGPTGMMAPSLESALVGAAPDSR